MAGVRMTGLISGMDTESLVKGMIDAQKMKNKKVSDKATKLDWKQEKWKDLNSKLLKLYTDELNSFKLQGSYLTKKASSTDETKLTASAGVNAPEGSHKVSIDKLASAQYLTGVELGSDVKGTTKLTDLGIASGTTFEIKAGTGKNEKTIKLNVNDSTTISDFVQAAKDAGLNASFDADQGRLFMSSKQSGAENSFTIETYQSTATQYLEDIKSSLNYKSMSSSTKSTVNSYLEALAKDPQDAATVEERVALIKKQTEAKQYFENLSGEMARSAIGDDIKAGYEKIVRDRETSDSVPGNLKETVYAKVTASVTEAYEKKYKDALDNGDITQAEYDTGLQKELDEQKAVQLEAALVKAVKEDLEEKYKVADGETKSQFQKDYEDAITADEDPANQPGKIATAIADMAQNIANYVTESQTTPTPVGDAFGVDLLGIGTAAKHEAASDLEFKLNGADMTSSSNTVTVNGITINALDKTDGKDITVTVGGDKQAVYDMVKKFVTSYNTILDEMNKLYYAGSSRGYDPLSEDEQGSMTESQIEKWEGKIKDSILRRDTKLGSVMDSMKRAMMSTVTVDGKQYSLSSYGIHTSTDYTEKGLLHIDGNSDDALFSSETDKLMAALEKDPDTVMKVLSGIGSELSKTMQDKMKSVPNVSSAMTFYDDKLMIEQQSKYKKQMSTLESKLIAMENKYYKQFAAMETALAKMQSQSNSLAGMLGS